MPAYDSFHLFTQLPTELRLKIWRLAHEPRLVEIQLRQMIHPATHPDHKITPLLSTEIHPTLHASQEAQEEFLSAYRRCSGTTFTSPHPSRLDLYNPLLDTLFLPASLFMVKAQFPVRGSVAAPIRDGANAEFVLDRLAIDPDDVAQIRSLAILWADVNVRDAPTLLQVLKPYEALRELTFVFIGRHGAFQDLFSTQKRRGLRAVLVEPTESRVQGEYMNRVLREFLDLAANLNKAFRNADAESQGDGNQRQGKLPTVNIKMVSEEEIK